MEIEFRRILTLDPCVLSDWFIFADIVDRIVDGETPPYRPVVVHPIENAERLLPLMRDCWRENPDKRPSFQEIKYEVESAMARCGL